MVLAFKYTRAVYQMCRCRSIMVSCRYECVPGCARMRMYAHFMLLCLRDAYVQSQSVSSSVPAFALTQQASGCASCARFDSPKEGRTDRTATAERMTHVRGVPVELLLLHLHPSFARSDPTASFSRRSSGSEERKRVQQSCKCCSKLDVHSKPFTHRLFPLLNSCCI